MEFLQRFTGRVSLQIDTDRNVRITGMSFIQSKKDWEINVALQLYAQVFNLDAA